MGYHIKTKTISMNVMRLLYGFNVEFCTANQIMDDCSHFLNVHMHICVFFSSE